MLLSLLLSAARIPYGKYRHIPDFSDPNFRRLPCALRGNVPKKGNCRVRQRAIGGTVAGVAIDPSGHVKLDTVDHDLFFCPGGE